MNREIGNQVTPIPPMIQKRAGIDVAEIKLSEILDKDAVDIEVAEIKGYMTTG